MRARAWQGYRAVGLLVTGAAWVLPTVVRAAPMASRIGCYELLSAAAVAAIVLGMWWHRPGVRLPWVLFAGAQLAYFAGDVTFYTYQQLLHDARFPAPADGLYLAHYPLFVAGLLLLLRRRSPGRDRDGLLDALIVTTGIGLLAWVFVLGPYVRTAELSLPVRAVSLAYPLMDLLVVAVAARLAMAGGARPPAYWLLLASLTSLLAADGWYALAALHGSYQTGQLLDAGWLLSYVGWGAAALHPSMRELSEPGTPAAVRLSPARLAAVALAALVAPAVLFIQTVLGEAIDGPVIAGASALLFGLTLLRMRRLAGQAATQAERARLLHRLGAIIDASPVAIVELDRSGRVQLWNPAAERIYGWRPEEVLGRPHPASLESGWPAIQPTATRGLGQPAARVELRQHRSDGTPIEVELSTAPLQTPSGEPAGMIGVAADITDRKRLAEQLRHQALHDPLTDLANRALFHDRLEHALARLDLHSGRITGLEALVRWQHPTRGLLAPGSFISLAEETGLLVAIGAWVLHQACRQTRSWQASIPGCQQLSISVNLSVVQLAQPHLAAQVAQTLAATGLEPRHLTLELTESLLVADIDTTAITLAELDGLGVRLAIDDFGTGYSSLSYLRRLPVDVLKIDKAFVDEVASSPDAAALTQAIIDLAATFGLDTVAEGIEQLDQLQRLRELGCQHGQGYYFAKPLDEEQLAALLDAQQPLAPQPTQPATA